jgi:hypothetical protein
MTDSGGSSRGGMAPWAKWSIIGCGGCLTIAILVIGGGGYWFYNAVFKNMKFEMFDTSGKRDMPVTATAGQLLPPRVGAFVRQSVGKTSSGSSGGAGVGGWQGTYVSGGKQVTLIVAPTASVQASRDARNPFGMTRQQSQNPNTGFHMRMKLKSAPTDMAFWQKTNWSFIVQSRDELAMPFAKAYQPAAAAPK